MKIVQRLWALFLLWLYDDRRMVQEILCDLQVELKREDKHGPDMALIRGCVWRLELLDSETLVKVITMLVDAKHDSCRILATELQSRR